jgi:hypothetical protein
MNRLLPVIIFLSFINSSFGQESELSIGEWKAIIPYNVAQSVTQDENNVYMGSNIGLLITDKSNINNRTRLSRVDGLSDINIQHCIYDEQTQNLVLIYSSLIIDILGDAGITTNLDLKNFNFTQGVKEVNSINSDGAGGVLISGNFGLSRFDVANEEFSFTVRKLGLEVFSSCVLNNTIYLASNEGIYYSDKNNPAIDDLGSWTFFDSDELPAGYESYAINSLDGKLYMGINQSVYSYDNNTVQQILNEDNLTPLYINTSYDYLVVGYGCVDQFCDGPLYLKKGDDDFVKIYNDFADSTLNDEYDKCFGQNKNAIADQSGKLWLCDNYTPIRTVETMANGSFDCKEIYLNNIASKGVFDIELNGEEIWVAAGGYTTNYDYLFNATKPLGFVDNSWKQFDGINIPNDLTDFSSVEVHPESNDIFFGSYLDGLVHLTRDENQIRLNNIYNDSNSTLTNIPGDDTRTRIGDLEFDADNNLWVANYGSNIISVFTSNSEWLGFETDVNVRELISLTIDDNGYKWFIVGGSSAGLFIYDSGEDLESSADDRELLLTTNNSNLPTNDVKSITVDKNGDVWVGTQEGPIVFDCASNIFGESGCQGSLRIGETDDIGAYLLETETINCIGVDGANRKWFGTDNGIFVQSETGENQIFTLNTENSPLFSNRIQVIKFHPENGEVFIGTGEGIMVLRGEAIDGETYHSPIEVFPNPVRPEYEGPITIRGVSENSRVKITTVDGKLVYETIALGGQAVWDGRDLKGRKPETGVYLIFASSDENFDNKPKAAVGKFLIVR